MPQVGFQPHQPPYGFSGSLLRHECGSLIPQLVANLLRSVSSTINIGWGVNKGSLPVAHGSKPSHIPGYLAASATGRHPELTCACVEGYSTSRSYKGERGFPSHVHHTRVVIFYRLRFWREGRGGLRLVRAGGRWRGVSFDVYATCFCIASMTYLSTQSERVGSASSPSTYSAST